MIDIRVSGLVKSFDLEKKILDGVSFQVDAGERVGLLGKNGAGKTTLFRILTGELDYDSGEVQIASGRRLGLISQIPVYPAGFTVEDVLRSAFGRMAALKEEMDALTARMAAGESDERILRRYGDLTARFEGLGGWDTDTAVDKVANGLSISREMRTRLFDALSGGEKTRVNLGRLILEDTDILLLDEPTNHLDIASREWIEEAVEAFDGTLLFVSHDRYFIQRFATRVWELADGTITDYPMGFAQYRAAKAEEKKNAPAPQAAPKKGDTRPARGNREKQAARRQLTICETGIGKLEARIADMDRQMEAVACDPGKLNELYQQKQALEQELEEQMVRWEELSLLVEE